MVCICTPASQGHGIVVHNHLSHPTLYVTRPSASVPKTINDLMLVALSAHVTIYLLISKPMMTTSHTFSKIQHHQLTVRQVLFTGCSRFQGGGLA